MDKLSKVDVIVFDKTGTLTKGKPEVTDIKVFGDIGTDELLGLVAKAETISEHHLGQTIVKEAEKRNLDINNDSVSGEIIKGSGIKAVVDAEAL